MEVDQADAELPVEGGGGRPRPEGRHGHSRPTGAVQVYAIGGFDGHERLRIVEAYDYNKDSWIEVGDTVAGGRRGSFSVPPLKRRDPLWGQPF